MCCIYVCVQVFMCLHMYIVINKYAMSVMCVHESVNMINHLYVFDKI